MVKTGNGRFINGDIGKTVTEYINQGPMIKFLMGKNHTGTTRSLHTLIGQQWRLV